jgi:hypothetical protein
LIQVLEDKDQINQQVGLSKLQIRILLIKTPFQKEKGNHTKVKKKEQARRRSQILSRKHLSIATSIRVRRARSLENDLKKIIYSLIYNKRR